MSKSTLRLPRPALQVVAIVDRLVSALGLIRPDSLAANFRRRWLKRHCIGDRATVEVSVSGIRLSVPGYFVPLALDRPFDPLTTCRLRRFLQRGMVVVDVGAHIGYYTALAAACVGPRGRVFAVEPAPDNLELLQKNAVASTTPVIVLPVAAGAKSCPRTLHLAPSSDGHSLYLHPMYGTTGSVVVDQHPLDDLVSGSVDLVKIDVEGAELEVLEGMSRILKENRNIRLLVEWNPACLKAAGRRALELVTAIAKSGFSIRVIDEAGRREGPVGDPQRWLAERPDWWFANLWAERTADNVGSER